MSVSGFIRSGNRVILLYRVVNWVNSATTINKRFGSTVEQYDSCSEGYGFTVETMSFSHSKGALMLYILSDEYDKFRTLQRLRAHISREFRTPRRGEPYKSRLLTRISTSPADDTSHQLLLENFSGNGGLTVVQTGTPSAFK